MISWGYIVGAKLLRSEGQTSIISVSKTTEQWSPVGWGCGTVGMAHSLVNDSLPLIRSAPAHLCLHSRSSMIQILQSNRLLQVRDFQDFKQILGTVNIKSTKLRCTLSNLLIQTSSWFGKPLPNISPFISGLKFCVLPEFICWNTNPNVLVFEVGAFGQVIR